MRCAAPLLALTSPPGGGAGGQGLPIKASGRQAIPWRVQYMCHVPHLNRRSSPPPSGKPDGGASCAISAAPIRAVGAAPLVPRRWGWRRGNELRNRGRRRARAVGRRPADSAGRLRRTSRPFARVNRNRRGRQEPGEDHTRAAAAAVGDAGGRRAVDGAIRDRRAELSCVARYVQAVVAGRPLANCQRHAPGRGRVGKWWRLRRPATTASGSFLSLMRKRRERRRHGRRWRERWRSGRGCARSRQRHREAGSGQRGRWRQHWPIWPYAKSRGRCHRRRRGGGPNHWRGH